MNDIGGLLKKFIFESPPGEWAIKQLRELLIGALQQGPVPQHVAFEMDGNRRYARSHRMETVEGHHRGFEALARVCFFASQFWETPRLTLLDYGDLLQGRREDRYRIRVQH